LLKRSGQKEHKQVTVMIGIDPHKGSHTASAIDATVAALRSPSVRPVAAEDHQAVMRLWAKRHRELTSRRTQVVCRLHAVLCELIPGGMPGQLYSAGVIKVLEGIQPEGAMATARYELACDHVIDLLRIDDQIRQTKKHMTVAVKASKTTLTGIYGVGAYVAATVKGEVGDVSRFASRHHFAAYNGTAPIEVSSGPRKIYRLSRRGNRRLNHAIHMDAVTQIRHRSSPGRAYYDRKRAQGKTGKEAIRALKRRISDVIYAALLVDARQAATGPGGQAGNDTRSSAAGSHPVTPALRTSHSRTRTNTTSRRSRPTANRKISRRAS
jgi:transposase